MAARLSRTAPWISDAFSGWLIGTRSSPLSGAGWAAFLPALGAETVAIAAKSNRYRQELFGLK